MSEFEDNLRQKEQDDGDRLRNEIINNLGFVIISDTVNTDLTLEKMFFTFICSYTGVIFDSNVINSMDNAAKPIACTTTLEYDSDNIIKINCQLY